MGGDADATTIRAAGVSIEEKISIIWTVAYDRRLGNAMYSIRFSRDYACDLMIYHLTYRRRPDMLWSRHGRSSTGTPVDGL
jgi:hypothetical protein